MSTTNTSNTTEVRAQHTPGPWRYETGTKTIRAVPANYWLATMDSRDGAVNHEANARLIAECPAMLSALQGCAAALVEAGKDFALSNARAARPNLYELHAEQAFKVIARATGQSGKAGAL